MEKQWTTKSPTEPGNYWHRSVVFPENTNIINLDAQGHWYIGLQPYAVWGGEWWPERVQEPTP